MLTMKQRRPTFRTLRGWAVTVLQDAGAIRECTSMPGPSRPRARHPRRSAGSALWRLRGPGGRGYRDVLGSIGVTCPECPPE